jgi:transcription elongation factor Elf1
MCGARTRPRTARSGFDVEHYFTCPHCGEQISMVLDPSILRQSYVEDCEVCCRPIELSYTVEDDTVANFTARAIQ